MVTGWPAMISNRFDKVGSLHGQELGERRAARLLVVGEDHFAHGLDALFLEEHVLGAAKPDALGAETNGGLRICRRVGVGAYAKPAHLVGPANQGREFTAIAAARSCRPCRPAPVRSSRRR